MSGHPGPPPGAGTPTAHFAGRLGGSARLDRAGLLNLSGALLLLLPLSSAADVERVPVVLPAALGILSALSAWRPDAGLVVLATVVPISGWLGRAADLHDLRMAEALVLAVLTGALVGLALDCRRRVPDRPALPSGVWPAACLLAAAAAASVAVEWLLTWAGAPFTLSTLTDLVGAVGTTYLYRGAEAVPGLVDAVRLIEGAALALVILDCGCRRPTFPRRLAVACVAGAAAAATVNLWTIADFVATSRAPVEELIWQLTGGGRLAGHVGDLNAAGSYFLMMTLAGIGLTTGSRGAVARACGLATLAAGAAFWLSGSRAALAAGLVIALAAAAARTGTYWPALRRRTVVAGVAAAVVMLPILTIAAYPGRGGMDRAVESGRIRVEFVAASLRMWSSAPLFGVGAGRYYGLSPQFMGRLIEDLGPENAHNNFLQVGAELGLVGFVGFVGLLAAGGVRVREALRTRTGSPAPLLAGASAGAAAYLITCLAGHPLLVPETAYPFWMVGGLAAALAQGRADRPEPPPRAFATGLVIGLLLAATVPFRVDAIVRDLADRQDSRFGAFSWELDSADRSRLRWIGSRATFFVPGGEEHVVLPLRALHAAAAGPVTVDVAVGGRHLAQVPLVRGAWTHLPLRLPASGGWRGLHRIDLAVDPPWPPEERRNGDARTLGVQVGEIRTPR